MRRFISTSALLLAACLGAVAISNQALAESSDEPRPERPFRGGGPEGRRPGFPSPDVIFDHLDADQDGVISREEFRKSHEERIARREEFRERFQGRPPFGPPPGWDGDERRRGPEDQERFAPRADRGPEAGSRPPRREFDEARRGPGEEGRFRHRSDFGPRQFAERDGFGPPRRQFSREESGPPRGRPRDGGSCKSGQHGFTDPDLQDETPSRGGPEGRPGDSADVQDRAERHREWRREFQRGPGRRPFPPRGRPDRERGPVDNAEEPRADVQDSREKTPVSVDVPDDSVNVSVVNEENADGAID